MEPGEIVKTFKSQNGKEVVIRSIRREDLDGLLNFANDLIREDTFIMLSGKKISRGDEEKVLNNWLDQISKKQRIHLVAMVNNKIAGSADVRRQEKRENHVGMMGISLSPDFRGEGIGSELFKTLIEEAKKMKLKLLYLHCFENNTVARKMYEKFGFKLAGIVPGMIKYKNKYIGQVTYYLPLEK